ncbi:TPA: hypothetical protein ACH3X3_008925 [Trebouxia sp. C0006]
MPKDDVVRPRRTWEQQQMKSDVPFTACSARYGRAAVPRAAPICPGKTLAAGRAVSGHSHVAARAVASPGHLPAVDGAVAIGLVAVQPLQAVIQDNVTEELVAKKGSSRTGRWQQPHKASAINLVPHGVSVAEVVSIIVSVIDTSGKLHAAQISKGQRREQPSSRGTPLPPSSVKVTLQQPIGQADTHAVTLQWTVGDLAWGWPRPSIGIASSMPSQHASNTYTASAIGKTTQTAITGFAMRKTMGVAQRSPNVQHDQHSACFRRHRSSCR